MYPVERAFENASVWVLYNMATAYATRQIKSAVRALEIPAWINRTFQSEFGSADKLRTGNAITAKVTIDVVPGEVAAAS